MMPVAHSGDDANGFVWMGLWACACALGAALSPTLSHRRPRLKWRVEALDVDVDARAMHFPFRRAKKKPKKTAAMDPDGDAAADSDGGACAQGPMFAMVCINNVNRSPAAHASLRAAGLRVCSFGAGRAVTFPGATAADSRVFKFRTPYETMQRILQAEDAATFSRNGVLGILERDVSVKRGPERWQSLTNKDLLAIDVVVCLDYAMFITVLEGAVSSASGLAGKTTKLTYDVLCMTRRQTSACASG